MTKYLKYKLVIYGAATTCVVWLYFYCIITTVLGIQLSCIEQLWPTIGKKNSQANP